MPQVTYTKSAIDAKDAAVKASADAHAARADNPHNVTAAQAGAYTTAEVNGLLDAKADASTVNALETNVAANSTAITGKLAKASNLSDLVDVPTARTNLGLGSAATQASTAFDAAGAAAAAQSAAQAASLARASNLSDVANAATARTNLGLGTMATQAASSVAITGGTATLSQVTSPTVKGTTTAGLALSAPDSNKASSDGLSVTITAGRGTDSNAAPVGTAASLTLSGGTADTGTGANVTVTPGTGGAFYVAGPMSVTGNMTGASVTATGAVSAASVAATGNVTAANLKWRRNVTITNGTAVTAGNKFPGITVPVNCTVVGWKVACNDSTQTTGTFTVYRTSDNSTYTNMTATGTKPSLTAANRNASSAPDWQSLTLSAGDELVLSPDSSFTPTGSVVVSIEFQRT